MGPQTYLLDSPVGKGGRHWTIRPEHEVSDTNSARQMRCERSRKPPAAVLQEWHFGFLGPHVLEELENVSQQFKKITLHCTGPGLTKMSNAYMSSVVLGEGWSI